MEPRLWELAAATRSLCVARGTSLVIYGLARVNERGPSAGVAYCTPPRLGRSRVEHFLFNLLVHNAPCFLHALIQLFVLLLNDLFLAVTRLFGCARGYLVLVQEHYTYLTVDLMERFVLLNTRCISSRLLECYRFFIGNYTRSL